MNSFSQLLRSRGPTPAIGTWLLSASPLVAEAVGCVGFDWGVIDMEHSALDLGSVVHVLQAVGNTKMVPVLRVPSNDPVSIMRVLDAGAQTLMIPRVQGADEARAAVAATRHAPQGVRGMAGMSRASRFGTLPSFVGDAPRSLALVIELESPQAVEELSAIASVPGVDALFVGPADLAAAMGHAGEPMHAEVMTCMADAVRSAHALGMSIGTMGASAEAATRYRAMGFDFIALSSDLGLLMRGAQLAVQAMRTADVSHVHTLAEGTRAGGG